MNIFFSTSKNLFLFSSFFSFSSTLVILTLTEGEFHRTGEALFFLKLTFVCFLFVCFYDGYIVSNASILFVL